MLTIDVADMAACGEGRNGDHRNAGAGPEEIDWLYKAGVVEAAALVNSDEDGGGGPLLGITLREFDDVLGEGFKEPPLRGSGGAIHDAIGLEIGDGRESAVHEIRTEIGNVSHMIPNHPRIARLILEWSTDIAIEAVHRSARYAFVDGDAIISAGNT